MLLIRSIGVIILSTFWSSPIKVDVIRILIIIIIIRGVLSYRWQTRASGKKSKMVWLKLSDQEREGKDLGDVQKFKNKMRRQQKTAKPKVLKKA